MIPVILMGLGKAKSWGDQSYYRNVASSKEDHLLWEELTPLDRMTFYFILLGTV